LGGEKKIWKIRGKEKNGKRKNERKKYRSILREHLEISGGSQKVYGSLQGSTGVYGGLQGSTL